MSKVKSPPEKKELSLKHDRRNSFGESPHASRKNIPRGKQRAHQQERRAVNQLLDAIPEIPVEDASDEIEGELQVTVKIKKLKSFKKQPDEPLGVSIKKKLSRR